MQRMCHNSSTTTAPHKARALQDAYKLGTDRRKMCNRDGETSSAELVTLLWLYHFLVFVHDVVAMALGRKVSVVGVMCAIVVVMAGVAAGESEADQYLSAHNSARRAVGAGVPDLKWSAQLQAYATNWARNRADKARCALAHSGGQYGENIFWSSGASTPAAAVTAWVREKQFYHYPSNSCASGKVCGHYTQVVWRNSQTVGCGSAICPGGGTFVVCSYNPPGNYNGQKPYLQSMPSTPAVEGGLEEA